jgi:ATP-dependent Clp protease ATP-binding subunit ClpC
VFEIYNEEVRRALFYGRDEAHRLGSRAIEPEHLLLGILREGEKAVVKLFRRFGVRPQELRREIVGERAVADRLSATPELPLSQESKEALVHATREAELLRHPFVGGEHLVIGILRVEQCRGARILRQHGLDVGRVREQVASKSSLDRILSGPY